MIEAIDSSQKSSIADFSSAHQQTVASAIGSSGQPAAKSAASKDSVTLSEVAQAKLMEQQGKSVTEIAQSLHISNNTVLEDLGLANASLRALTAAS